MGEFDEAPEHQCLPFSRKPPEQSRFRLSVHIEMPSASDAAFVDSQRLFVIPYLKLPWRLEIVCHLCMALFPHSLFDQNNFQPFPKFPAATGRYNHVA